MPINLMASFRLLQIAIEGCAHGELDSIYASLALTEQRCGAKVDVLLICGDFQAVRNAADLAGMACPAKYRAMQSFYKYYSGEATAPCLTIFIGGNHEASSHLCSLPYGGWVAPNIFFVGHAGVVNVGGVRIGGLSGIYNQRHYQLGHYEHPPFSDDDMRSFYHIRELDVMRLMQLRKPLDVFLSHDWPQHIARHGDTQHLLRRKAFLRQEIDDGSLGSPPAMALLHQLKPSYWFSAHLHVKFAAVVHHAPSTSVARGEGGVGGEGGGSGEGGSRATGGQKAASTRFLSLSKCLPDHDFLQLLQVEGDGSPPVVCFDAEWIAVLRATQHLHSSSRERLPLDPDSVARASDGRTSFVPTAEEVEAVHRCFAAAEHAREQASDPMDTTPSYGAPVVGADTGSDARPPPPLAVPLNFSVTAPAYQAGQTIVAPQAPFSESPQTSAFVATFGLEPNFRKQRGATQGQRGDGDGRGAGGKAGIQLPAPSLPAPPSSLPTPPSLPAPPRSSDAWAAAAPFVPASAGQAPVARPPGAPPARPQEVPILDEEIDLDD